MSPTQRSLALLRNEGYLVAIVEHFNQFAKIRQDLFAFADILAVKDGVTLAVQTTSGANMAARRKKLAENPNVAQCIRAGWKIELHGWAPHKVKRGGKAFRTEIIREEIL